MGPLVPKWFLDYATALLCVLLNYNFDFILPMVSPSFLHLQGGVTEEQMLKYMGANTSLSVLQAKELLEVNVVIPVKRSEDVIVSSHLFCNNKTCSNSFQDEEVGFAYISLREARPSL